MSADYRLRHFDCTDCIAPVGFADKRLRLPEHYMCCLRDCFVESCKPFVFPEGLL